MYAEVIETRDRFRVVIEVDDCPENPRTWGDCFASVLTQVGDPRRFIQPDKDFDQRVLEAWDRTADTETVERYARAFLGAVAVGWWSDPRSASVVFGYVTAERAAELGVTDPEAALHAELDEYEAWADGEVYVAVVQERAHWQRTDEGHEDETREEWETVDSIGGLIGSEYAEEYARELLDGFEPKAVA